MITDALQSSKLIVRQEVKKRLAELSKPLKKQQSDYVVNELFQSKEFRDSKRISVYLSTENEICTVKILQRIFHDNKHCFVPRYNQNNMEMVRLLSMDDYHKLPLTKWNIKQPHLEENREEAICTGGLNLIIVPGVAFTKNGKRLGHGKGYYDKYLNNLIKRQNYVPKTVALVFKEQLLDDIPCNELDFRINRVIFPPERIE